MRQAFKKRGQNHVHENDGQAEGDQKLAEGALEFAAAAGNNRRITGRHIEFASCFDQGLVAIGESVAWSNRRLKRDLALAIESIDLRNALRGLHIYEVIEP